MFHGGANGIFKYKLYRDREPIVNTADLEPLYNNISGDATSFVDTSPKKKRSAHIIMWLLL